MRVDRREFIFKRVAPALVALLLPPATRKALARIGPQPQTYAWGRRFEPEFAERDFRKELAPEVLERQAKAVLRDMAASGGPLSAAVPRLRSMLKRAGREERRGFNFLIAHLPAEYLADKRELGGMEGYVREMYALRKKSHLPWLPGDGVREDLWLLHVLMPRLFGEGPDFKGHLQLQKDMLRLVSDKAALNEAYEKAFGRKWVEDRLSANDSPISRALKEGVHDLETALQVADHAKFLFMAKPQHYSPTQPPTKGDMSITEMIEAAAQGVRFRGTNWTVFDQRAAAVLGIGTSSHVWGQYLADRAPFATVVDLKTGSHALYSHFGEGGNPAANKLRTTTVERFYPLLASRIRTRGLSETRAGTLVENVTHEFAALHLPGIGLSRINFDLRAPSGKPVDGMIRAYVIPSVPDMNSPRFETAVPTTVSAASARLVNGKARLDLGLGNPREYTEDPWNQWVQADLKRGIRYVFVLEAKNGERYGLNPDTLAVKPGVRREISWRLARMGKGDLKPYETFDGSVKPFVLHPRESAGREYDALIRVRVPVR